MVGKQDGNPGGGRRIRDDGESLSMIPDTQQQEIPFGEKRFRGRRFRRGIYLVPSIFTAANLLCGYYAVVASLVGGAAEFDHAARAIGFAILFDSVDGRIARMTG